MLTTALLIGTGFIGGIIVLYFAYLILSFIWNLIMAMI
jgi:hypothetical protein